MACDCRTEDVTDPMAQRTIDEIADRIGLKEIFSQARDVFRVHYLAHNYLKKSQRAERLGFGEDLRIMYLRAATREGNQAIRQIDAVIAGLENRIAQPDWNETLTNVQQAFRDHDGEAGSDAMKERLREALLEKDGLSPDVAVTAQNVANSVFDSLVNEGLSGPVRMLQEALLNEREQLLILTNGPDQVPPRGLSVNQEQVDCITVAVAIAAAAFIVCCFIPYCWCCYTIPIAIALAFAVGICLALFD